MGQGPADLLYVHGSGRSISDFLGYGSISSINNSDWDPRDALSSAWCLERSCSIDCILSWFSVMAGIYRDWDSGWARSIGIRPFGD
jgi:hypothetical protein